MQVDIVRSERIKAALARRYPNGRSGANNPNWQGGRRLGGNGYIEVYMPSHPAGRRNYVMEHRLVMEKHLGRYLRRDEHVHHINHDKLDNRIENLELLSQADHARGHMATLRRINALEKENQRLKERICELVGEA